MAAGGGGSVQSGYMASWNSLGSKIEEDLKLDIKAACILRAFLQRTRDLNWKVHPEELTLRCRAMHVISKEIEKSYESKSQELKKALDDSTFDRNTFLELAVSVAENGADALDGSESEKMEFFECAARIVKLKRQAARIKTEAAHTLPPVGTLLKDQSSFAERLQNYMIMMDRGYRNHADKTIDPAFLGEEVGEQRAISTALEGSEMGGEET